MGFLSKPIKTLDDLFVHTLQDIYYAEQKITKALPKMIEKVHDPELKQGFQTHLTETKNQVKRLEKVFQMHGMPAKAVTCPAIDGIVDEAEEILGDARDNEVLDAAAAGGGTGGGALRDRPLRHPDRLGAPAGPERLRAGARGDAPGGESDRPRSSPRSPRAGSTGSLSDPASLKHYRKSNWAPAFCRRYLPGLRDPQPSH